MLASAMLLWLDLDPIVVCGLVAVAMWVAHAYFGCSLVADLCCGSLGTVFDHKHFLYSNLQHSLTEVRDASGGFVPVLLAIRERILLVEAKYVCATLTN